MPNNDESSYQINVAGIVRELPIVPVSSNLSVAFLKLYGDNELLTTAVRELANTLDPSVDYLVGAEAGGILVAYELSRQTGIPYLILRKKWRPNMEHPLTINVNTIGTAKTQRLFVDDLDAVALNGRNVAFVDEVISSGATMEASCNLVEQAGGKVCQRLAVALEGKAQPEVTSVFSLPLFRKSEEGTVND